MVADTLKHYGAKNIVVDPVMVSTSGARLLESDAMDSLVDMLFPLAEIITPNIPEAELLLGTEITGQEDVADAARSLSGLGAGNVLIKERSPDRR